MTGGGLIDLSGKGRKATFSFAVRYSSGDSMPSGNLQYIDHVSNLRMKATSFDLLIINGDHATITGTGIAYGQFVTFTLNLVDFGKPGSGDRFMIEIPDLSGYSAGGALSGGNIQIH